MDALQAHEIIMNSDSDDSDLDFSGDDLIFRQAIRNVIVMMMLFKLHHLHNCLLLRSAQRSSSTVGDQLEDNRQ